jgi:alkaline phosphatase
LDLIASGFDYFGGGGIAKYDSKGKSIYTLAQETGYTVARTQAEVLVLKPGAGKVIALGDNEALSYAIDSERKALYLAEQGLGKELRLPDYTKQAIELLDNPNGFFIMIEGGKIDWACHNNDAAAAIMDIIEFDNAVELAFVFAKTKPGEVLIVVTGDHETGGLVLGLQGSSQIHVSLLSSQKASRDLLVPLTERFMTDNGENASFEQFKPVITEKCGLIFSETGIDQSGNLILNAGEVKKLENDFNVTKVAVLENKTGKDTLARTMLSMLNSKAGIGWASGDHTALPVNTSTWGNQAEQIAKNIKDNTDIGKQLKWTVLGMGNNVVPPQPYPQTVP